MARRRRYGYSGPLREQQMLERINSWPAFLALGWFGTLLANIVYIVWRLCRPLQTGRRK
jgi:hypothetical protein